MLAAPSTTPGGRLAKVAAAIAVGVRHFDASLAGSALPFAVGDRQHRHEDVVFLAEIDGFNTGHRSVETDQRARS